MQLRHPGTGLINRVFTVRLHYTTCRQRTYTDQFATLIGLLLLSRASILIKLLIIQLKREVTKIR